MTFILAIPYNEGVVVLSDKRDSEDKNDRLSKKYYRVQGTSIYLFGSGWTNPLKNLWADIGKSDLSCTDAVISFVKDFFKNKIDDKKYQNSFPDQSYFQELFIFSREDDLLKFHRTYNADSHNIEFKDSIHYIGSGGAFMNIQMQRIRFNLEKFTLEKALSFGISLIDFISEFKDSQVGLSKTMGCDAIIFSNYNNPEEKEIDLDNDYSTNFFELYKTLKEEGVIY